MAKKVASQAKVVGEVEIPLTEEAALVTGIPLTEEAALVTGIPLTEEAALTEVPKVGIVKVRAVIRPMYAPHHKIMIPEGSGVLLENDSWVASQLERGLLKIVE